MVELLTVASILGAGLLAGGLVAVAMAVLSLVDELGRSEYVRLHRGLDSHFDPFLPVLNILTMLSAAGRLAMQLSGSRLGVVAFGLSMAVSVALLSQLGNRPINQLVGTWTEGTIPPSSGAVLRRWRILHQLRTAAAVLGLVAYAAVAVMEA